MIGNGKESSNSPTELWHITAPLGFSQFNSDIFQTCFDAKFWEIWQQDLEGSPLSGKIWMSNFIYPTIILPASVLMAVICPTTAGYSFRLRFGWLQFKSPFCHRGFMGDRAIASGDSEGGTTSWNSCDLFLPALSHPLPFGWAKQDGREKGCHPSFSPPAPPRSSYFMGARVLTISWKSLRAEKG